jgi:hypothetical protein
MLTAVGWDEERMSGGRTNGVIGWLLSFFTAVMLVP